MDRIHKTETPEPVLEPSRPIVDPHHHLHDLGKDPIVQGASFLRILLKLQPKYVPQMPPGDPMYNHGGPHMMAGVIHRYMVPEFAKDISDGHNIVATVGVEMGWFPAKFESEALMKVGEVEGFAAMHEQDARIHKGIVAHADLRLGKEVAPALEYYEKHPLVKGIRHSLAKYEGVLPAGVACDSRDEKFREGFALLEQHGLVFDSWIHQSEIEQLTDLAKSFPNTKIVCNHFGGYVGCFEASRAENLEKWKRDMQALGAQPNAYCKLSGVGLVHLNHKWENRILPPSSQEIADFIKPFFDHCISCFGSDRCMFGSNFPPDKAMFSYRTMWNAFKLYSKPLNVEDKHNLFYRTAKTVYKLDIQDLDAAEYA